MEAAVEETQKDGTESVIPDNSTTEKTAPPPQQDSSKKTRKDDRNKRDDRSIEQFMKGLNSVPLEEKVSLLCKKYVQLGEDNKKMQFYIKQSDKRHALILKEKEQLQLEYNKSVLVKSKLENLCRELQKQNRAIKEESLLKLREEEERRKETQAKFQNTLSEITTLLQQNNEKNAQLRDDNISMSEKFKSVVQQYQLREEQVDKMAKQMALESELSDAKMQKASLEHQAERERLLAELEHIKVTMAQYRAKIVELQGTEDNLRSQLAVYTDKYNEFQNALVKSNQFYGGFKEQMELMSKKIKKLEKESLSWKKRWESSQTTLIEMCGERQASEEKAANVARQLTHMQGLCRTLQGERTLLLGTLKDNNIERPPLPMPPPIAAATLIPPTAPHAPASNAKVDAMAANCAQLRQSLAHLQSQLNVLTSKQQNTTEEPPKQEKPKKSKSKKNKDKQKNQEKTDAPPSAEAAKQITDLTQTNVTAENKIENECDIADDKADDKTLETLIEAINSANINLSDLEVGSDELETLNEVKNEVNNVLSLENSSSNCELIKQEIQTVANNVIEVKENSTDDTSKAAKVNSEEITIEENGINEKDSESLNGRRDESTDVSITDISNMDNKVDITSMEEISHKVEVKQISDE